MFQKNFQYKLIKIFYKNVFLDNDSVKEGTYEILKETQNVLDTTFS